VSCFFLRHSVHAVLKLSHTAFQKVTSCNSGLTFARISVQKSGGVGDASPLSKKPGTRRPPTFPPHYTPGWEGFTEKEGFKLYVTMSGVKKENKTKASLTVLVKI